MRIGNLLIINDIVPGTQVIATRETVHQGSVGKGVVVKEDRDHVILLMRS
jgi:hypothetical protein